MAANDDRPRILVAGAGALGSGFGAMLRLAGCEVSLLSRNRAHMDAVRSSGLAMTGLWGERTATGFEVFDSPSPIAPVDYVLVTTKSFDTAALVEAVAPTQPAAQFVTLQNGLGNVETVERIVGPARTIGGMVIIGFAIRSPGAVAVTVYGGDVMVGRPLGGAAGCADGTVRRLVATFCAAGITTHATDNIRGAIWGKALYNCALNALGAVLGVAYGELKNPHTWAVIEDIAREAYAVAASEGVGLPWPDPDSYLRVLADEQVPATARHRSSMLQDIERGRRTEIEYLNGAIARIGGRRGVATPVNAALAALVRHLEAHGRGAD